ncbi:hypothetical protein IAU60_000985 [Kwoniella sp. DSM 27419]
MSRLLPDDPSMPLSSALQALEVVSTPRPRHEPSGRPLPSLTQSPGAGPSTSQHGSISSSLCTACDSSGARSQASRRRERRRKLVNGQKERDSDDPAKGSKLDDGTAQPSTPQPLRQRDTNVSAHRDMNAFITPRRSSPLASVVFTASRADDPLMDIKPRRKTRRGGKKARRRAEGRLQAHEVSEVDGLVDFADDQTTSPTSSAQTSRCSSPVQVVVHRIGADGEEDEVDDLSDLEDDLGTPRSIRSSSGSVMCVEDAVSSIDSFLSDPRNFMTIKANKLRLWQSLCIELGLVYLPTDESSDFPSVVCVPTPPRPRETTPEPAQPYIPTKHPLPQTLTQARKILRNDAHINLADYLEARRFCPPAYVGAFQGLLYPSRSAMRKYTRDRGRFAEKDLLKAEWLEPLMRDFGMKNRRVGLD